MSVVRVGISGVQPNPSGTGNARGDIDGRFGQTLDGLLARHETHDQQSVEKSGGLRWSRHATARLRSRGIELDTAAQSEIADAVGQLQAKGAKESLVLYEQHAFIVGVQRQTVITAMTRDEAVGSIFTNIDSTIVVR